MKHYFIFPSLVGDISGLRGDTSPELWFRAVYPNPMDDISEISDENIPSLHGDLKCLT